MSSRASGTPYPGFQTGSFHDPWSSRILVLVNPSRDSNQLIFQLIFKLPSRGGPPADFKLFDRLARPLEWSLGSPRGPVSLGGSHPSLLGPKPTSASRKREGESSFGSWTGAQPTSGEGGELHLSTAPRGVFRVLQPLFKKFLRVLQPQFKWWSLVFRALAFGWKKGSCVLRVLQP
jgi:hypothetical protein